LEIREGNGGHENDHSILYACMKMSQWSPLLCTINIKKEKKKEKEEGMEGRRKEGKGKGREEVRENSLWIRNGEDCFKSMNFAFCFHFLNYVKSTGKYHRSQI
jgi:hypothetical protein